MEEAGTGRGGSHGSSGVVKHSDHFVHLKSGSARSSGEGEGLGGMRGVATAGQVCLLVSFFFF